ncbi:hypothetical protein [Peribacillus sp. NPDC096448]|uniref:hypothetical protein n=1 Tax=Peribacillus sp. NPDC096448 TaxID=3364395 RepID=UPI0038026F23
MKPYGSFDQRNHDNGNGQNAHPRKMGNDFLAAPYPLENQIMDVRTPPGPPGPSYGGGQPPPRPPMRYNSFIVIKKTIRI